MTRGAILRLAGWLFLLQGCSSSERNVGAGLLVDRSRLESYAASWDGYAEAYEFASGSDRVRLDLAADGSGTIRFGDVALAPPPTDPNDGYPPEFYWAGPMPGYNTPYEPFVYTVRGAYVEDERIRFELNTRELYAAWCAILPPVVEKDTLYTFDENGMQVVTEVDAYVCAPRGFSYDPSTCPTFDQLDQVGVTDCEKHYLCDQKICTCTAESCALTDDSNASIDAVLDEDGSSLEGTLVLPDVRMTVRLKR